jgi:hypothetical protein
VPKKDVAMIKISKYFHKADLIFLIFVFVSIVYDLIFWNKMFGFYFDLNPKLDLMMDHVFPYLYVALFARYILYISFFSLYIDAASNDKISVFDVAKKFYNIFSMTIIPFLTFEVCMYARVRVDILVVSAPFDCFVTAIYITFITYSMTGEAKKIFKSCEAKYQFGVMIFINAVPTLLVNSIYFQILNNFETRNYLEPALYFMLRISPAYFSILNASYLYISFRPSAKPDGEKGRVPAVNGYANE